MNRQSLNPPTSKSLSQFPRHWMPRRNRLMRGKIPACPWYSPGSLNLPWYLFLETEQYKQSRKTAMLNTFNSTSLPLAPSPRLVKHVKHPKTILLYKSFEFELPEISTLSNQKPRIEIPHTLPTPCYERYSSRVSHPPRRRDGEMELYLNEVEPRGQISIWISISISQPPSARQRSSVA